MLARLQDIENNWMNENDKDIKEFMDEIRHLDPTHKQTFLQKIKRKISNIIHRRK
jgi:hypothetical protein